MTRPGLQLLAPPVGTAGEAGKVLAADDPLLSSVRRASALLGSPCATRIASYGHAGGKTAESEYLSNGVKLGETSKVRDRKSTRLNSSHLPTSRMPSSA